MTGQPPPLALTRTNLQADGDRTIMLHIKKLSKERVLQDTLGDTKASLGSLTTMGGGKQTDIVEGYLECFFPGDQDNTQNGRL